MLLKSLGITYRIKIYGDLRVSLSGGNLMRMEYEWYSILDLFNILLVNLFYRKFVLLYGKIKKIKKII
jgi:hypothetical protein